jgi:hypothetical protein
LFTLGRSLITGGADWIVALDALAAVTVASGFVAITVTRILVFSSAMASV